MKLISMVTQRKLFRFSSHKSLVMYRILNTMFAQVVFARHPSLAAVGLAFNEAGVCKI